jgi:hypothetical protein
VNNPAGRDSGVNTVGKIFTVFLARQAGVCFYRFIS